MSNVHGFERDQDVEANRGNGGNQRAAGGPMLVSPMSEFYINQKDVPTRDQSKPERENFCQMLRNNVCPVFSIKSAVGAFLIFMTVIFILQRIIDHLEIPGTFLLVKKTGSFSSNVGLNYVKIAKGQLWRLLTGSLGWVDLSQWFSISIFTLFFMTNIQYVLGLKRCICNLYFIKYSINVISIILSKERMLIICI